MKKMNNKGFSLVELIIVIAIMAILIVVLAPQYLKYVEKSRNSTDLQSATEFRDACEIWAADPDAGTGTSKAFTAGTFSVTVKSTGIDGTIPDAVQSALDNSGLAATKFKCMSRNKWDEFTLTGEVKTDGSITWSYSSKAGGNANDEFEKAMGEKAASGGTE